MITITSRTLEALGLSSRSSLRTVQAVRERICDDTTPNISRALFLLNQLIGISVSVDDLLSDLTEPSLVNEYALMITQAAADVCVKSVGQPFDEEEALDNCKARALRLLTRPEHRWMFAKGETVTTTTSVPTTTATQAVASLGVQVAVNAQGKIKKGGKEVLASELYKKFVLNADAPLDNKGFVQLLMTELSMTKAGATTYAYNMRKKHGERAA